MLFRSTSGSLLLPWLQSAITWRRDALRRRETRSFRSVRRPTRDSCPPRCSLALRRVRPSLMGKARRNKFYAVKVGRQGPHIYLTWEEVLAIPLYVQARDLEAKIRFNRRTRTCVTWTRGRMAEENQCLRSISTRARSKRVSTRDVRRRNG